MADQKQSRFNPDDFIDLRAILTHYIRITRERWYIPLLLIVMISGALLVVKKHSLNSSYYETAYYSVTKANSLYQDVDIASTLASGIGKITSIPDFKEQIKETLQVDSLPCTYSISAISTESANLFSVAVTCDDAEYTSKILDAFIEIYPSWANLIVGNCILTVTDRSDMGTSASSSWTMKKVGIFGVGGGIALWLMIATLALLLSDKLYSQKELDRISTAPCLGMLPEIRKRKGKKNGSSDEPLLLSNEEVDDLYLKSIRSLRTRTERLMEQESGKVYMIASAFPKEGRSLLTLNLAMDLQHHGKQVAVIDADMRANGVSALLKQEADQPGLSDYLRADSISPEDCMVHFNKLMIIPAGTQKEDFARLLNRDRMDQLLDYLSEHADIVLVDTPPVDYFGDALVVSNFTDGILFLIRAGYADKKVIKRSAEIFEENAKIAGFILNRVKKPIFDDSEYRYYVHEHAAKRKKTSGDE